MYTICVSGTVAVNVSHLGYKRQRMWYRVIMHRGAAEPSSQLPGRPVATYGGDGHVPRRSVRYGGGLEWRPQMRVRRDDQTQSPVRSSGPDGPGRNG